MKVLELIQKLVDEQNSYRNRCLERGLSITLDEACYFVHLHGIETNIVLIASELSELIKCEDFCAIQSGFSNKDFIYISIC